MRKKENLRLREPRKKKAGSGRDKGCDRKGSRGDGLRWGRGRKTGRGPRAGGDEDL
jgi:hypothetical protein